MNFVYNLLWYTAYMLAFFALLFIAYGYNSRMSESKAVERFFSYVKKGRRRVALLGDHVLFLFSMECLFPLVSNIVSLPVYFVVSIAAFYSYSLDRLKKHRHNGINIGYEYPHPVEVSIPGALSSAPAIAGSKGIYDLQIKSEPNPHAMIIGETGFGKTNLAITFLARAYDRFKIPFLIIDWGGTYKDEINVNIWHVPTNLKVNPFRLRNMSAERRSGIVSELLQFSLSLTDLQTQKVRETLMDMYQHGGEPDLVGLHDRIIKEMHETSNYREIKLQLQYIANKLKQAFEIFGDEPETFWDNYDKTCCVIDLNGLTDSEKKLVTYAIIQRIIEEFKTRNDIRMYIALDDAYQALLDYYGKETNITKVVREGRKYGFGLLIATQMLKDLPQAIIANTSMKFIFSYHEPYDVDKIYKMLKMTEIEKQILHRMPKGSCFMFDQNAIQNGKAHPAYIEVDKLDKYDKERLAAGIKRLEIGGMRVQRSFSVDSDIRVPQVSVYRFIVAMHRTGEVSKAIKWLTERRLITSNRTLYGGSGMLPIAQRATEAGYLDKEGKLTTKALHVVEPALLVNRQGERKGGADHEAMMKRIIEVEQEKGNFAFVPEEGFDVGSISTGGRKGAWNPSKVHVYEVQTTSIRSEIDNCILRARNRRYELTFVTNSNRVKTEIEDIVGGQYKVLKIRPYGDG